MFVEYIEYMQKLGSAKAASVFRNKVSMVGVEGPTGGAMPGSSFAAPQQVGHGVPSTPGGAPGNLQVGGPGGTSHTPANPHPAGTAVKAPSVKRVKKPPTPKAVEVKLPTSVLKGAVKPSTISSTAKELRKTVLPIAKVL